MSASGDRGASGAWLLGIVCPLSLWVSAVSGCSDESSPPSPTGDAASHSGSVVSETGLRTDDSDDVTDDIPVDFFDAPLMEIQGTTGLVLIVREQEPLAWPEALVSGTLEPTDDTRCLSLVTDEAERAGVVWPVGTVVEGTTVVLADGTVLEAGTHLTAVGGLLPDGVEDKLGEAPTCSVELYITVADIAVVPGGQK